MGENADPGNLTTTSGVTGLNSEGATVLGGAPVIARDIGAHQALRKCQEASAGAAKPAAAALGLLGIDAA